jgi:hypothetical protein
MLPELPPKMSKMVVMILRKFGNMDVFEDQNLHHPHKRKEKFNASITYSLQVRDQFESMTQLSDPQLELLGLG